MSIDYIELKNIVKTISTREQISNLINFLQNPKICEVIEAVSNFMKKNNINDIHITQEQYASFFIIKT